MVVKTHTPRETDWRLWGGIAAAAIIVIGALGYWFDWFGTGTSDTVTPAVEQTAPATENAPVAD